MARLNTVVLGITNRVRQDERLASVLLSIASGGFTKEDYDNAVKLVTRVFWLSGEAGYGWQSQVIRRRGTRDGLVEVARQARDKGALVTDAIVESLESNPELVTSLKNTVLAEAGVREGVGKGQLVSADEAGLGYKTWKHTGIGDTNRAHHVEMDGTTIRKSEKFVLPNGKRVSAAHDWSAPNPAKEWVNCHCVCVYTNRP